MALITYRDALNQALREEMQRDDRVFLIDPEHRGVLPLDGFHVSRRLARTVRQDRFEIRANTAFHQVVLGCADAGPGRAQTWINRPIEQLYLQLHEMGHAHSVEAWQDGELVGAAKVAIELAADLPAYQAAQVERLTNSSLMITEHYRNLTTAHIANIGKGKGY